MAKLYFRYGAMNCGKSTSLLQVAHNYEEKNNKIILIKPEIDSKGEDKIISRIGISKKVDYLIGKNESIIEQVQDELLTVKCLLVDEAQFFNESQIDELFKIAKIYDIPVICYGLRTDFKTNFFCGSKRLMELADELEELSTICLCGQKARFNSRIVNGEYVNEGKQVEIEEEKEEKYESLCGKCYLKKVLKDPLFNNKPKK